jgi:hypothetical protein
MIRCENRRCEQLQFFENTVCTACGKRIKPKAVQRQIEQMRGR